MSQTVRFKERWRWGGNSTPKRNHRMAGPKLGIAGLLDEKNLRSASARRLMLHCMPQPTQSPTSIPSANFAGLLAALALPPTEDAAQARTSSESDRGDDVVTLSYDRALRTHGRYMPTGRGDWQPAPAVQGNEDLAAQANQTPQEVCDHDLRTSSVTVRLSKAECANLHQRAAEAGLTVSAYLRSCTIEAEALRAQVKAALAELRPVGVKGEPASPARARRPLFGWLAFGWLARLLPHRRSATETC